MGYIASVSDCSTVHMCLGIGANRLQASDEMVLIEQESIDPAVTRSGCW